MSRSPRAVLLLLIPLLGLVGGTGCGSPVAKVRGQIVSGGQPIVLPPDVVMSVEFAPNLDEGASPGPSASAEVNPQDGSFVIEGPASKGIPPGKYRISVALECKQKAPTGDDDPVEKELPANLAWIVETFDASTSPLGYEVTGDKEQSLVIDLKTQTVTVR